MLNCLFNVEVTNPEIGLNNGCAIAVGSFDGVHLGHREMIKAVVSEAKVLGIPAAVFTFDTEDNPKGRRELLADRKTKYKLLTELGINIIASIAFSAVKSLSAEAFVNEILYNQMNARAVICGYDFRFGFNREGDYRLIEKLLSDRGVKVVTVDAVSVGGVPISSTEIRRLITTGDIEGANRLLGREFGFSGEVISGKKIARWLGFPTANIKYPTGVVSPRYGVYLVRCTLRGSEFFGVANIGVKPTFGFGDEPLCEINLFGFDGECYGEVIEVAFAEFIREEIKFDSPEALSAQIEKDKETANRIINERGLDL